MDAMKWEVVSYVSGLYLQPMKESFPGRLIASRHRQSPDTCNNGPSSPTSGTEGSTRRIKIKKNCGNAEVSTDFAINLENSATIGMYRLRKE